MKHHEILNKIRYNSTDEDTIKDISYNSIKLEPYSGDIEKHIEIMEYKFPVVRDISYDIMVSWHKMIYENGEIRHTDSANYPRVNELPYYIEDVFDWYNRVDDILHPFYRAAFFHLRMMRLLPFQYGSGVTSRLLMNYILYRHGYPPINIKLKDRKSYHYALESSSYRGDWKFIDYITNKYIGDYREYWDNNTS